MKDIVLDFGNHQMYLSGKYYTHRISGDLVLVECTKGTEKGWVYRFSGFSVGEKEIRFLVKEEEPLKRGFFPKQAKTHAK
jgi:hypothetical protein